MLITEQESTRRREHLGLAIASARLEGGAPSPALLKDADAYAQGLIDDNEFVSRMRRRYGLDARA